VAGVVGQEVCDLSLLDGTALPSNSWRWAAALALGFFAGVFTVISDSAAWPGWYPVIRGGVVDMIPAAVALKMTLTPSSGTNINIGPKR
jgi:hypothetical protein